MSKLTRSTKYCVAIENYLKAVGHATNAEILEALRRTYPDLSATTVHRVTLRMASRKTLQLAPKDSSGSMRYDSNLADHDHFVCSMCGKIKDVYISHTILPLIEGQLEGCHISGNVTVSGTCNTCRRVENQL